MYYSKEARGNQAWWLTPLILTLTREGGVKRKASLSHIVSSRPVQGTGWTFKKKVCFLTPAKDHEGQACGFLACIQVCAPVHTAWCVQFALVVLGWLPVVLLILKVLQIGFSAPLEPSVTIWVFQWKWTLSTSVKVNRLAGTSGISLFVFVITAVLEEEGNDVPVIFFEHMTLTWALANPHQWGRRGWGWGSVLEASVCRRP